MKSLYSYLMFRSKIWDRQTDRQTNRQTDTTVYRVAPQLKIISRDSRDTRAAPNRVHDQPWSFIGPYRVL